MRLILSIISSVLLMIFPFALMAHGSDTIQFNRIPFQDSIQHSITSIIQDKSGFMWIGTQSGLYKHNGYTEEVYKHNPGNTHTISNSFVTHICLGANQTLWIGTETGTIDRLNTKDNSISHYTFEPGERAITGTVQIHDLISDNNGIVWVSTSLGGLYQYDPLRDSFTKYNISISSGINLNDYPVLQILDNDSGMLFLSVEGIGPVNLDTASGTAELLGTGTYNVSGWGDATLYQDSQNNLWVGTWGNGLMSYNQNRGTYAPVRGLSSELFGSGVNFIKDIVEDNTGNLWIVPLASGVLRFNTQTALIEQFKSSPIDLQSLNSDDVEVLFKDRTGLIWIGSTSGLNNYSEYRYKFSRSKIAASAEDGGHNYVLSLFEDSNNNLWIGTLGGGLYRSDNGSGNYQNFSLRQTQGQGQSSVFAIYEDSRNDFYVGTGNAGLLRLDRNNGTMEYLTEPLQVTCILEDKDGLLWIGTFVNGVGKFDRDNNSFEYWSPDPDESDSNISFDVTTILEDSKGYFWIGSSGRGLIKYNKNRESYIHFQQEQDNLQSLSDNRVLSICEDQEGFIWVGTRSGMNKINPLTNEISRFYEGEILPDNVVCTILEDSEGYLWISTFNGVTRFNPVENRSTQYSIADGLQGSRFNPGAGFKNSNGQIFWGGVNGYNSYMPGEFPDNRYEPIIAITAFRVLDDIVALNDGTKEIELQYNQNFFSFEFAALDYTNPEMNKYAYKLDNLENDWINGNGRRFARYTKVPPGKYTFVVQGSNNDGLWNRIGASVRVTVFPPFWMTWQFRAFAVLLFAGIIYSAFKVRMRMIQRQKDLLEVEVAERSVAQAKLLTNQTRLRSLAARLTLAEELERKRISRALHDDVGHALLTNKVKIIAHMDDEDNSESAKSLQAVIDSLNATIKIVRSLTVDISPPALHKFGLESAAERLLEKFGEENNFRTRFSKDKTCPMDDRLAILLYQSLRELLVNILKHAEAETIRLSFNNDGTQLFVRLQDDGKGFIVEQVQESDEELQRYGLFSIQERLESIGGQLKISSKKGVGTTITMIGPLSDKEGQAGT